MKRSFCTVKRRKLYTSVQRDIKESGFVHRPQQLRNNLVEKSFGKGRPAAAQARDMTQRQS